MWDFLNLVSWLEKHFSRRDIITTRILIKKRTPMTDDQKAAFQAAAQLLGLAPGATVTVTYTPPAPEPVTETFTVA